MKVLVTGIDGFTGQHFRQAAENAGWEVVGLASDLLSVPALEFEVQAAGADAVVHLAAISFVGHDSDRAFYEVNTIGTCNLLNALKKCTKYPQRVILASSANVYGNCQTSPIPETQAPAPVNHYASSKLAMEHLARTFLPDLPLVFVRPFNYTGAGQSSLFLIPKLVDAFRRRVETLALGNTDVQREFSDVRDVCAAYVGLRSHGVTGETYNVCAGRMYSLASVLDVLESATGYRPAISVDPKLVRANEVLRLGGDASRLKACIGDVFATELRETLDWMLSQPAPEKRNDVP